MKHVNVMLFLLPANNEVQKNTDIPLIKIPLNIARRNHYLDSR